jgi:hypothetical protein
VQIALSQVVVVLYMYANASHFYFNKNMSLSRYFTLTRKKTRNMMLVKIFSYLMFYKFNFLNFN